MVGDWYPSPVPVLGYELWVVSIFRIRFPSRILDQVIYTKYPNENLDIVGVHWYLDDYLEQRWAGYIYTYIYIYIYTIYIYIYIWYLYTTLKQIKAQNISIDHVLKARWGVSEKHKSRWFDSCRCGKQGKSLPTFFKSKMFGSPWCYNCWKCPQTASMQQTHRLHLNASPNCFEGGCSPNYIKGNWVRTDINQNDLLIGWRYHSGHTWATFGALQ